MNHINKLNDERINNIQEAGKWNLLKKISARIANEFHEENIENLRTAFDVLFWKGEMTAEVKEALKKFNLAGLQLSDDEKTIDSEAKSKWLIQYWQDLAHVSMGVYTNMRPVDINIDIPQESGKYKFIFINPGIMRDNEFALVSWTEDAHIDIFRRYHSEHTQEDNETTAKMKNNSGQAMVPGGWRIEVDAKNKHLRFYGSSGNYGYIADKVIEWATQKLRNQWWETKIEMDYAGRNH